jgi:hypothetical protein
MFTVECRVGRLLEIRMTSPLELADVLDFRSLVTQRILEAPRPVIACTDLRRARIFAPEAAIELTAMMKHDNPKLLRNAFLVGESALFSLQIERLLREAGPLSRRTFRDTNEARQWLKDQLDEQERWRLSQFVIEYPRTDRFPSLQ